MQTFCPLVDFYENARVLHPKYHLGNQYYREGMILLTGGWKNHPASKMWRNYRYALTSYLLGLQAELQRRGKWYGKTAIKIRKIRKSLKDTGLPAWIGDPDFHASHRSSLLFKGSIFAITDCITKHLKKPYKKWSGDFGLPARSQISAVQREHLLLYCADNNLEPINWYKQFEWSEPDDLSYVWPKRKLKRREK